jgi:hypothetical protein
MPPQPEGIWNSPYNSSTWETNEGDDRYRRGLYTYWKRTAPYPSMLAFDSPTREVCVSRRVPTNTPLQALVMLNDPVFIEAGDALARRMIEEGGPNPDDRLRRGYHLVLQQEPDSTVLAEMRHLYVDALRHYHPDDEPTASFRAAALRTPEVPAAADAASERAAMSIVAGMLLNLDRFVTKE